METTDADIITNVIPNLTITYYLLII